MNVQRARWAEIPEFFEQLYMSYYSRGQLPVAGLQIMNADSSLEETAPSYVAVREAMTVAAARLRGGMAVTSGRNCSKLEMRPRLVSCIQS